ncbi:MAG: DUF2950 domain-containing protein [Casimicrobiaceae bacterium]
MHRMRMLAVLAALSLAVGLGVPSTAWAQKMFPSADAAADAFVDALSRHDGPALKEVMGPEYKRLIPVDGVDPEDVTNFLAAWAKGHKIVAAGNDRAALQVGDGWTLPIPLTKNAAGWSFDTSGAADEMRTRRIGRDELAAIQAAYAYVDAQREYAATDHNKDGVLEYAQKIVSTPGKRDGLFWPNAAGEIQSPLGPLLDTQKFQDGFHGYKFKILKAQGSAARGGARDYVQNGRMTRGFALVAWPARWGDSGVMSFQVNHDGVVFEKDLGANTAAIASAMTRFAPDSTWKALPPPQ